VASAPGGQKTNEDLLAEIFGGSNPMSPVSPTSASQPQRTTASDILSLFDSPAPTQATSPAVSSLFDLTSTVTPTSAPAPAPAPAAAAPAPKPAAPKLQSYTAYNKNDLTISLTPQRSATQKGVVDILARFQVTGSSTVTGINFQVAVPKVRGSRPRKSMRYLY
jgi:AP-1 complex subunit gamma-1